MGHIFDLVLLPRSRCLAGPAPKTGFLTLPTELRMLIYEELLLAGDSRVVVYSDGDISAPGCRLFAAILRVCKKTYAEALPILYRRNTFEMLPFALSHTGRCRRYLSPSTKTLIRRVITISGTLEPLDQKEVERRYQDMGVPWERLNLWACFVFRDAQSVMASNEDWLMQPRDAKELEEFGVFKNSRHWSNWLIRKGSTRQSLRPSARGKQAQA